MTGAIVGMELRLRARTVVLAALGLVAVAALVGALYPSLGHSIGQLDLPKGVSDLIGGSDLGTIRGWLRTEIVSVYGPLVFAAVAITSAAATTAGEEEDRILALLVAKPVPRWRLLLAKAGGIALLLALLAAAVLAGLLLSVALAGGGIGAGDLAAVAAHLLMFALAVGALTLALGAGTGRRGLAAGTAAAITLAMYLLNGLAPTVHTISWLKYLTVFHYYEGSDPITTGADPAGLAILAAVTAVLTATALATFRHRDLRA
jgi:ABC-2 type transport system permease protein